jgi:hypothetical protein
MEIKLDPKEMTRLLEQAQKNIYGFNNLITVTQALMLGYFCVAGSVPLTFSMSETLEFVDKASKEYREMTSAWGYEA